MNQTHLIANADGSCFSTIVGLADSTQTDICVLGSNFFSAIYLYVSLVTLRLTLLLT
jgi:hypothetical protein